MLDEIPWRRDGLGAFGDVLENIRMGALEAFFEGFDDDAASERPRRRERPDDIVVSRSGHDGIVQKDLDQALPAGLEAALLEQIDARRGLGGPGVELHLDAIFQVALLLVQQLQLAQVPLVRSEVVADRDDVAALNGLRVPLGDVQGGALAGHRLGAVAAIDLDRPEAAFGPLRQEHDLVADRHGPARRDPGHDRAVAFGRERPLHRHAEDPLRRSRRDACHQRLEGLVEFLESLAGDVRDGQDRGILQERAGQEAFDFLCDGLLAFRRDDIDLRQGHDPMRHAQQGEDIHMLAGLRHDAVVGCDHEDAAVDPGGARHHCLDEVLVAGDIDDADLDVGDDARGKAQLDRHATFLLDLEPVRVAAGQELDQCGLAVVDMPGGAERDISLLDGHGPIRPIGPIGPVDSMDFVDVMDS
ncbi:MAG: hypothetical protein A2Y77_11080 [Planctomycetes bacterium RBG_13_62_9]|nr:MAG: hypothetical protein A2Y77_11080 [Planctomycetes bacterium RBG_13_62_9]